MASKIVSVVGARPQFVKAAVVSAALAKRGIEEVLIHTGQHYDANMSDVFFDTLSLPKPKHHLGIGGGTHAEMTGRQLIAIERCLLQERPDVVVVYGDTNSTLAGALAAAKLHIRLAHVEAGLRSFNMRMPEEINRVLTDRISDVLYAPSTTAANHLKAEGIDPARVLQTGDVMFDAALRFSPAAAGRRHDGGRPRALVTVHRAENTDEAANLRNIVAGLAMLAEDHELIFPIHPRTRQRIDALGLRESLAGVHLLEPLGYVDLLAELRRCRVVLTDSGGLQKEAYFMGVPCVTLRRETEWVETVELGWNRLVADLQPAAIAAAARNAVPPPPSDCRPFGDGNAAERIAAHLAQY